MIVGTGWRVIALTLHAYTSSGAGSVACCKNSSAATAANHHITVGWNAVAEVTSNFYLICNQVAMILQTRE